MTKKDNRPKGKLRLTVEFADNGMILRDRDTESPDNVWLALFGETNHDGVYDYDHTEEYKTIGRRVYKWLTEEFLSDHFATWCCTGAELDINATLTGRPYK